MNINDQDILKAIGKDKDQGFTLLVKAYSDRVYWHVRRLVEDFHDTEDVVQETFLRIYKSLDTFREEASLKTWIYRIATNEALRHLEKRNRDVGLFQTGIEDCQPMAADEYINFDDAAVTQFQKAIDALPARQRAVFNLRYYDELPYDDIAQILDTSVSSAKASYHVAKEKIKTNLTA